MIPHRTRLAIAADEPALAALIDRAIAQLQADFLSPEQISASRLSMGLDPQLIADGTYYVVEAGGVPIGCGGWSRHATLYGGATSAIARDPRLLDPACDPALIRAMYTAPGHERQGVGRVILRACEGVARAASYGRAELMATLAGESLYCACDYHVIERVTAMAVQGNPVPGARIGKNL